MKPSSFAVIGIITMVVSGCVVNRTVRDSSGNIIYSEPEVHNPFESEEKKRAEVIEKQRELGW